MNINLKSIIKRIIRILLKSGTDCLVVRNLASIHYLTGCRFHSTGDAMVLVRQSGIVLFTDARYYDVKKKIAGQPIRLVIWERAVDLPNEVFREATRGRRKTSITTIGFERENPSISFGFGQQLRTATRRKQWGGRVRVHAIPDLMQLIRSIKSPAELRLLRKAHALADQALRNTLPFIKPGVTELEIAQRLNIELRRLSGEDEISFATIVASGLNGANAHATPSKRKIKSGDLVTIDFGCVFQGYHSDTTRTVIVGELKSKLQKIFDVVLGAQQAAQKAARPGMTGQELDAVARDYITKAGYGKQFIHGTGHGVGLDIHEKPHITPSKYGRNILEVGMVFSIEPGIYIEGLGGVRIENVVVITEDGCESLCRLPLRIAA